MLQRIPASVTCERQPNGEVEGEGGPDGPAYVGQESIECRVKSWVKDWPGVRDEEGEGQQKQRHLSATFPALDGHGWRLGPSPVRSLPFRASWGSPQEGRDAD